MNRRSFFTKLGLAAASVAILPAATTYARSWVAPEITGRAIWTPDPRWTNAPYEMSYIWHPQAISVYDKFKPVGYLLPRIGDSKEPERFIVKDGRLEQVFPWKREVVFHQEFQCEPFKS